MRRSHEHHRTMLPQDLVYRTELVLSPTGGAQRQGPPEALYLSTLVARGPESDDGGLRSFVHDRPVRRRRLAEQLAARALVLHLFPGKYKEALAQHQAYQEAQSGEDTGAPTQAPAPDGPWLQQQPPGQSQPPQHQEAPPRGRPESRQTQPRGTVATELPNPSV